MSERYWGLTWGASVHAGIEVAPVTFEECLPFMTEHYAQIFETEPDRFFEEKMTPQKLRFLAESDCFLFRLDGKAVGLSVNNPSDWSSYYMRTYALLPEVRGRDFSLPFLRHIFARLKEAGVKRVELDTSPTNVPVQRQLLQLGMFPASSVVSERWGVLLRMTGFLDEAAERAYRRQFLHVPGVPTGCLLNPTMEKGVKP